MSDQISGANCWHFKKLYPVKATRGINTFALPWSVSFVTTSRLDSPVTYLALYFKHARTTHKIHGKFQVCKCCRGRCKLRSIFLGLETCKAVHFMCAFVQSVDLYFHLHQSHNAFQFGCTYLMGTSNRCIQGPLPLRIWQYNGQTSGMRHRINFSRPRANFPRKIVKKDGKQPVCAKMKTFWWNRRRKEMEREGKLRTFGTQSFFSNYEILCEYTLLLHT